MGNLTEITLDISHECNAHCFDGHHAVIYYSYLLEGDEAIASLRHQMDRFGLDIIHYRRIAEYELNPDEFITRFDTDTNYWTQKMGHQEIKEVYEVVVKGKTR